MWLRAQCACIINSAVHVGLGTRLQVCATHVPRGAWADRRCVQSHDSMIKRLCILCIFWDRDGYFVRTDLTVCVFGVW